MREFIIALVIGTPIGLTSSYLLATNLNQGSKKEVLSNLSSTQTPASSVVPTANAPIVITDGTNTSVVLNQTTKIKATYKANTELVFSSMGDFYLVPKEKEGFEFEITPKERVESHRFLSKNTLHTLTTITQAEGKTALMGVVTEILADSVLIKDETGVIQTFTKDGETKTTNLNKSKMEIATGDTVYLLVNNEKTYVHEIIAFTKEDTHENLNEGLIKSYDKSKIEIDSSSTILSYDIRKTPKLIGVAKDRTTRNRTRLIASDVSKKALAISDPDNILKAIFIFD